MGNTKASYQIRSEQREEIIRKIEEMFGLKHYYNEDYIHMRGDEGSGIESVGMSLEKDVIKVRVVIEDDSLLDKFNSILGEPTRVKSRRRRPELNVG